MDRYSAVSRVLGTAHTKVKMTALVDLGMWLRKRKPHLCEALGMVLSGRKIKTITRRQSSYPQRAQHTFEYGMCVLSVGGK